jgi:hypothetical protein
MRTPKRAPQTYRSLEGRLAAIRMLEDKGMREALEASFEDEEEEPLTLSQARALYLSQQEYAAAAAKEPYAPELKEALLARMSEEADAAVAEGHFTEELKEELVAAMEKMTGPVISAAASAAGVAAARAAGEVTGSATDAAEEAATQAAREAVEKVLLPG